MRAVGGAARAMLALPLAACVPAARPAPPAPGPSFSPLAFFAGATAGEGTLTATLSRPRAVHVRGEGRIDAAGALVLVQRVEEEGRPARERTWRLRAIGDGRFAGTLSDATGPVAADVRGNRLHVAFRAKGGLGIEQWLYLRPDGQGARNHMVVRALGVPVATLDETIRRVP